MRNIKFYLIGIIIAFLFFIIGVFTLSNYGINIDEPIHFERGNAYLDFFLSGKTKYTQADFSNPRISEWKYIGYDTNYFLKNDSGHPPLNGILAAATNRIFHEKLGIIGDLEGYHLFELFISSLLVFLVFAMVRAEYGVFAGTTACLSLVLYPLFYGESHYNIKDPVEASFFAFTLYFFYLGARRLSAKYFIISSLFCALAFGTKFNIIFAPFIIVPFLAIVYGIPFLKKQDKIKKIFSIPKVVWISLVAFPLIVIFIHFLTRPYLWSDPINHFMQIVDYYQGIGTGTNYQSSFIKHGLNTYPIVFVGISTPVVILFYSLMGALVTLFNFKNKKYNLSLLFLIWFVISIGRVSLPGTSIYGGVRQIMEYIPAMAALSGVGAIFIKKIFSKYVNSYIVGVIIVITFIPTLFKIIELHPNENLFINNLVGGIKGATERKIPGVGETMGNAYLQGILWLDKNAPENSRFGFPVGLGSNFPPQFVRKDIKFGGFFSGMKRDGEYMIEMKSVEYPPPRYNYQYLDTFLNPVYVKKVDGTTVVTVWKNDIEHTKKGYINEKEVENVNFSVDSKNGYINISWDYPYFVTRLEIEHDSNNCLKQGTGSIYYSVNGENQMQAPDDLFGMQGRYPFSLQTDTHFVYFLAGFKANRLSLRADDLNLCLLKTNSVKVKALADIKP